MTLVSVCVHFLKLLDTQTQKWTLDTELDNSAIPAMKKMLNEEEMKLKRAMKNIIVPREHCFNNSISVKI